MTTNATLAPAIETGPTTVRPRQAAIIAGISYVALFALAIFGNFVVREGLVVGGDAELTASNIAESEALFRLGLVSFLIIFLLDVVVAWALHLVFRPMDHTISQLAAWFRIVYTVMLGVAIIFFFQALQLLSGASFLRALDEAQLQAQALVALETFNSTWLIGLTAFGLHLILLGYLIVRHGVASNYLGWVLMTAGAAYIIDTMAHGLLANYADYATPLTVMVAVPSVVAEGWFGLWLLFRAGRPQTEAEAGRRDSSQAP